MSLRTTASADIRYANGSIFSLHPRESRVLFGPQKVEGIDFLRCCVEETGGCADGGTAVARAAAVPDARLNKF